MAKFNVGDKVEILGGTFAGYYGKVLKAKEGVCKLYFTDYTSLVVEVHKHTPSNHFGGVMATLSCFDASVRHIQPV